MLDDEDRRAMRTVRNWVIGVIVLVMLLSGISVVVSRVFDLAWFPWQVRMQTGMIRASNSYITTQQAALRQLLSGYNDPSATDAQRAGTVRQMHEVADTIPDAVQPDVRDFLAVHP